MRPLRQFKFDSSLWILVLVCAGATNLAGRNAGAQYLSTVGLSAVNAHLLVEPSGASGAPAVLDRLGFALAAGDFDGDGADDLACGIPLDNDVGAADAGRVSIRFGVPGVGAVGEERFVDLASEGSPVAPSPGQRFGFALATGDFNGDQRDDLAVGAPTIEDVSNPEKGAVFVHYGLAAPERIQTAPEHRIEPGATIDVGSTRFERLGFAVAVGDFNGDGFDDLAAGDPNFDGLRGAVVVAHGGVGGLFPFDGYRIDQDRPAIPDSSESGDRFGHALTVGDFNGDAFDDLAIGVPGEDDCGAVLVLFGSPFSLLFAEHYFLGEVDLAGACQSGDQFAQSLASGDLNGDGLDELIFGVPGQDDFDGTVDMGMVGILYGAPGVPTSEPAGGFNFNARSWWWEDLLPSLPPLTAESSEQDRFGQAIATADFNRDGFEDLAVGVPGNDSFFLDRGRVYILAGNPGLNLWPVAPVETVFEGVPGPTWEPVFTQQWAAFGTALAVGDFDGGGHPDLAVGLPDYDLPGVTEAGAALVLQGSLFSDGFESGLAGAWSSSVP